MFSYLHGTVFLTKPDAVVLLVGGVGYKVFVSQSFLSELKVSQEAGIHIYTRVAESALDLFGFRDPDELHFFEQLLSVSGVGPKTALEFFNLPLAKVRQAISEGRADFLSQVKGVGKKTAERICIDLRGKVEVMGEYTELSNIDNDALEGLVGLGYDRRQVEKKLSECPPEIDTTEGRIKWFLHKS